MMSFVCSRGRDEWENLGLSQTFMNVNKAEGWIMLVGKETSPSGSKKTPLGSLVHESQSPLPRQ